MSTPHREFWTQDGNGRDLCVAITLTGADAGVVWDAMRLAGSLVIEREHDLGRYKGKFVKGWSEEDGYFYAESPDEDPGSKHRGTPEAAERLTPSSEPEVGGRSDG